MTIRIPELFTSWTFWFAVAAVVVALAAILLVAILVVARRIRGHAVRALEAVRRIEGNTASIWALQGVLDDVVRIRAAAGAVAENAEGLAGAVHGTPGGSQRPSPGGGP